MEMGRHSIIRYRPIQFLKMIYTYFKEEKETKLFLLR